MLDFQAGPHFESFDPAVWLTASIASVAKRGMVTRDPIREAKNATARGDYESAIAVLRPLAEAGNRDAQYELGFLALTECDLMTGREAFSLFMSAAHSGHVEAMYHLATFPDFISEPFGSPLSEEETWQWLLRAAEAGSVQAQRDAGASLATGDWRKGKIPQDLAAAVAWYRHAAEAGHPDAQYNLASMLAEGEGCDRDLPAAMEWLRRAMAGGSEHAEGLLAHLDSLQRSLDRRSSVAIVVDPEFGNRLADLLERMPVWIADTETNRTAARHAHASRSRSDQDINHTAIGAVTTFTIDTSATPDSWCADILDTVAGHHDRYSHSPGCSTLEIYGTEPTPRLLATLAEYRLTEIAALPGGFRASTSDGEPAGSPNDS